MHHEAANLLVNQFTKPTNKDSPQHGCHLDNHHYYAHTRHHAYTYLFLLAASKATNRLRIASSHFTKFILTTRPHSSTLRNSATTAHRHRL